MPMPEMPLTTEISWTLDEDSDGRPVATPRLPPDPGPGYLESPSTRNESLRNIDLVRVGSSDGVVYRMSGYSSRITPTLAFEPASTEPSALEVRHAAVTRPGDVFIMGGEPRVFITNRIQFTLFQDQEPAKTRYPVAFPTKFRALSKADSALMPGDRVMAIAKIGGIKVGHLGKVIRLFGSNPQVQFDGVPGRPSITKIEKLSAPLNRVFGWFAANTPKFQKFEVGQKISFKLERWGVPDVFLTGSVQSQDSQGTLRVNPDDPAFRGMWLNPQDAHPLEATFVVMPDGTEVEYCRSAQALDFASKESGRKSATVKVYTRNIIGEFKDGRKE